MNSEGAAAGRAGMAEAFGRVRSWLSDRSHTALAQRVAGTAFLIRMTSAALLYVSHVLFARWMGSFEFGTYVYVWTWVLLIGGLFELGLAQGAQRFIPEYAGRKQFDQLRGFITGSRWLVAAVSTVGAFAAAGLVKLMAPWLDHFLVVPLYLACVCLPFYALSSVLEGIGRSYNWFGLALAPPYILRPLMVLLAMAAAYKLGMPVNAESAMLAALAATWFTAMLQLVTINRRLAATVTPGPRSYEVKGWLKVSLPIFLVESFYLLLTYTDVLMLEWLRSPHELAVYYAAAKTLALVAFVAFAVSAAVAHRFTEYHVSGDRERLEKFLADSIRWTFWPSLGAVAVILALGLPLLSLFGPDFTDGYPVMFVLAVGLLARAAVGPVERLLNMLGHQNVCAGIYALAFFINLAGCFVLIPHLGGIGAAAATSTALVIESILLFVVTKRRLGLHVFIVRGASAR